MAGFEEITLTLADGYRAYGRYWSATPQRGTVLYHHGIQSHCGWYEVSAEALARAGFAVLQVDRRGSGRNTVDRGHAASAEQLIGDALTARDELARRSGTAEHHVIGVSWGGKLAVAAYVHDATTVQSITLVTPGLFPRVGVTKGEMAKIGFAMLYEPAKLFDIPLNDAELFTTTPRWKQFFNTDEQTLRQCTAGFFLASRRMDKIVAEFPRARAVPVHLFIAGDERIIDNERTTSFVRELRWPQCQITCYDLARHSLEFEEDPTAYLGDLVSFIERQHASPSARPGN
ncbi:MAG: alpha/beta fold hydrolase [Phycisphaerae bacterium]